MLVKLELGLRPADAKSARNARPVLGRRRLSWILPRWTIRNVRIGYETYGRLNAARDNVIVISHYYTATSHAAGRYTRSRW